MNKRYDDYHIYQGRTIKQVKDSYKMAYWSIVAMIALLLLAGVTHALQVLYIVYKQHIIKNVPINLFILNIVSNFATKLMKTGCSTVGSMRALGA